MECHCGVFTKVSMWTFNVKPPLDRIDVGGDTRHTDSVLGGSSRCFAYSVLDISSAERLNVES